MPKRSTSQHVPKEMQTRFEEIMADHSFDIVSEIDLNEMHNAVVQAQKEILQRFDFRGTSGWTRGFTGTVPCRLAGLEQMHVQ